MLRREEIGGGYVERMFTRAGEMLKRGTHLTGDELRAMSPVNLRALVENRFLNVYPAAPAPAAAEPAELILVNKGFGKFDVVEGRKLNDEPMTKEDAEAFIASKQAPTN